MNIGIQKKKKDWKKPRVKEKIGDFFFFFKIKSAYFKYLFRTWQVENSGKPGTIKRPEMASHVACCVLDDLDKTETAVMPNAL